MSRTFIRLTDKNNENRASLLSQLHTVLSLRYGREIDSHSHFMLNNDLISTFVINDQMIGLISHQNPSQNPAELIELLIDQGCTIILFTSVSFEDFQDKIDHEISRRGFQILRSAPFWSSTFEFDYLEQTEVENIIDLLEILTEDVKPKILPLRSIENKNISYKF